MTSKEFVKQHMPNAKAESHTSGRVKGMSSKYWLIRDGRNTMWFAQGTSESNAWKNAKEIIIERQKSTGSDPKS